MSQVQALKKQKILSSSNAADPKMLNSPSNALTLSNTGQENSVVEGKGKMQEHLIS